jgi:hypothetical protein
VGRYDGASSSENPRLLLLEFRMDRHSSSSQMMVRRLDPPHEAGVGLVADRPGALQGFSAAVLGFLMIPEEGTPGSPTRAQIPNHQTVMVLDSELFQFGRKRPSGRVEGDADLEQFVEARVDSRSRSIGVRRAVRRRSVLGPLGGA